MIFNEKDKLIAVFPAAESLSNSLTVISHPGITYGGLIVGDRCRGGTCIDVFERLMRCYKDLGYIKLIYKAVPHIYHNMSREDDLYALYRIGAMRYRCDLSATIDMANRGRIDSRRKRGLKKAKDAGVQIVSGIHYISKLWAVLTANLESKHGAKPAHSVDEISLLYERFPQEICIVAAECDNQIVAGVVLFRSQMVWHAQYIASSDKGYAVNALDMVFEHCISASSESGVRYFYFGTSNENGGKVLNGGLYNFKSEFGAGGCVYEFYEMGLEGA